MGIRNRVELARLAIREGLAPLEPDPDDGEGPDPAMPWAGVLTHHPAALRAWHRIMLSCWPVVDAAFCDELVQRMTDSLEVAGAVVCAWNARSRELCRVAGVYRGRERGTPSFDAGADAWETVLRDGLWRQVDPPAEAWTGGPAADDEPVRAALGLRLDGPAEGEAVGGLLVLNDRPEAFGPDVEAVLRALSLRAASEVERIRR